MMQDRIADDRELIDRVARLADAGDEPQSASHRTERAAHLVWSRLVEPGDSTAGALIAALGAAAALDLVVASTHAGDLQAAVCHQPTVPELSPQRVAAGLRRWTPRLQRKAVLADIDRGVAAGLGFLAPGSPDWPDALADLDTHAPLGLWVRGDSTRLGLSSVAVVGARACTSYGNQVTADIVDGLATTRVAIVSGAAYGVDATAHRAALACELPTIAVLAGGADRPYPAAHRELLDRIAHAGVVCTEVVPGTAPTRWRFLQRNRVIAALSQATIVTEAGMRSGSLNTAGHACELGRRLGAVPGPVTSSASAGCHRLIREYDAALVTCADDVREILGHGELALLGFEGLTTDEPDDRPPPLHRRVTDALPLRGTRSVQEVARISGVGVAQAQGVLAELELLGHVTRRETPGASEPGWVLQRRE